MTESTKPDLSISEELLVELHRRLEAHRASPEDSEPWEIVDERIFGAARVVRDESNLSFHSAGGKTKLFADLSLSHIKRQERDLSVRVNEQC